VVGTVAATPLRTSVAPKDSIDWNAVLMPEKVYWTHEYRCSPVAGDGAP
jgi:hypothetical protein